MSLCKESWAFAVLADSSGNLCEKVGRMKGPRSKLCWGKIWKSIAAYPPILSGISASANTWIPCMFSNHFTTESCVCLYKIQQAVTGTTKGSVLPSMRCISLQLNSLILLLGLYQRKTDPCKITCGDLNSGHLLFVIAFPEEENPL